VSQEWDLLVLFFVGELDVANGISGVDVVRKIPHLTLLYKKWLKEKTAIIAVD